MSPPPLVSFRTTERRSIPLSFPQQFVDGPQGWFAARRSTRYARNSGREEDA
jgi:hypothetical protein